MLHFNLDFFFFVLSVFLRRNVTTTTTTTTKAKTIRTRTARRTKTKNYSFHKILFLLLLWILSFLIVPSFGTGAGTGVGENVDLVIGNDNDNDDDNSLIQVFIGFDSVEEKELFHSKFISSRRHHRSSSSLSSSLLPSIKTFQRAKTALAISLTRTELEQLQQKLQQEEEEESNEYKIQYIQPDAIVRTCEHQQQRQHQHQQVPTQNHPQNQQAQVPQKQQRQQQNQQQRQLRRQLQQQPQQLQSLSNFVNRGNPYETEVIPYGIAKVYQADNTDNINHIYNPKIPLPPPLTSTSTNEDCFRVCIIDTGLLINHPDIAFEPKMVMDDGSIGTFDRVTGIQLGLPDGQYWYNPNPITTSHGTHVTGTIFATGGNDLGVLGIISNPQGMCLSIARIFPDGDDATSRFSDVDLAVEWCANQGSKIINMSLGASGIPDPATQQIYKELYEMDGILIVAAAGNGGDDALYYPASFPNVMSVAAIDETNRHASFSQYNAHVDMSGPGVNILSLGNGYSSPIITILDSNHNPSSLSNVIFGRMLLYSKLINETDTSIVQDALQFVNCQQGFQICSDASGKACLIERGETLFVEKALNCQRGGGILAIIYNNADNDNNDGQPFHGSLGAENADVVSIPVMGITQQEGLLLLQQQQNGDSTSSSGGFLTISVQVYGYNTRQGTSMATPHVAGVAARIWSVRPECTNVQIQQALFATALNLGGNPDGNGRNDFYGHGLVQAIDAYNYILSSFEEPCGLLPKSPSSPPSLTPSIQPTIQPTISFPPSQVPSVIPSEQPTRIVSNTPTSLPTEVHSETPSSLSLSNLESPSDNTNIDATMSSSSAASSSSLSFPFSTRRGISSRSSPLVVIMMTMMMMMTLIGGYLFFVDAI